MRKGVIQTMVEESPVFRRIPYETTGALSMPVTYIAGVPNVPMRHINEAPATSEASFAQTTETLHIIDTDIDIDPVLLDNKNQVQKLDVAQTQAIVKSLANRVVDLFVNGDPTSDAREPLGIRRRLGVEGRFNGQTVAGATGANLRFDPGTTAANHLLFLSKLDELLGVMQDKANAFLVNRQTLVNVWALLRANRLLDVTKDMFDRRILQYAGVPFLDAGFVPASAITGTFDTAGNQTTQVIGNDADDYDAAPINGNLPAGVTGQANSSTVYAVHFDQDFCTGLQQTPMRVKPFGETDAAPHYVRTNVRWVLMPAACFQKRAIGRLMNIDATQ
jgi:hypothetical protein